MKIGFFDAKEYDIKSFNDNNFQKHEIIFFKEILSLKNIDLVKGFDAVCCGISKADKSILNKLKENKVLIWFQRSSGYNSIDLKEANKIGINIFRVSSYSPESIAEYAVALLMTINKQLIKSNKRVAKYNFSLNGLMSKNICNSTIGVIGAGKIGQKFIKFVKSMGANVLVFNGKNRKINPLLASEMGFTFTSLDNLLKKSDVISLHAPLLPSTKHIINKKTIDKMKTGVVLINTARGSLIDTSALIEGLDSKKIFAAGLDVLEREQGRFFYDKSNSNLIKEDKEWATLIKKENVLITPHRAYFTKLSLEQIAKQTLSNADKAEKNNFENCLKITKLGTILN